MLLTLEMSKLRPSYRCKCSYRLKLWQTKNSKSNTWLKWRWMASSMMLSIKRWTLLNNSR